LDIDDTRGFWLEKWMKEVFSEEEGVESLTKSVFEEEVKE
jgi:hypothetical protein